MRRTNRTSTNSPNVQSATGSNPTPPSKRGQTNTVGKKTCPPGFKLVNCRCEFVYDKTKYKKK